MKEVPVYESSRKGFPLVVAAYATVDDADYERVMQVRWKIDRNNRNLYAKGYVYGEDAVSGRKLYTVRMHAFILETYGQGKGGPHVDHIDFNGLNNCRDNLQILTCADNMQRWREFGGEVRRAKPPRPLKGNRVGVRWIQFVHNKYVVRYKGQLVGGFFTLERAKDELEKAKQRHSEGLPLRVVSERKKASGYKGVIDRRRKHVHLPWSAVIRLESGKRKWLGSYKTQEEAALAWNEAAKAQGRTDLNVVDFTTA